MWKTNGWQKWQGPQRKAFFYGHAQIENPFTKEKTYQCQIKNVRAPRIDKIDLKFLKQLLNDPQLIQKWVQIYRSNVSQDLPQVQYRKNQLDSDIQVTSRKINNLVQRVSELPADLPA